MTARGPGGGAPVQELDSRTERNDAGKGMFRLPFEPHAAGGASQPLAVLIRIVADLLRAALVATRPP